MNRLWLVVLGCAVGAGVVSGFHAHRDSDFQSQLDSLGAVVTGRQRFIDSLTQRQVPRDTIWLHRSYAVVDTFWQHDTLPGRVDTLPQVRQYVADVDVAKRACLQTVHDLQTTVDSQGRQLLDRQTQTTLTADLGKRPLATLGADLLYSVTGGPLEVAGTVTLFHGATQLIGRVEEPLGATPRAYAGVHHTF